jgi:hypothetical protein
MGTKMCNHYSVIVPETPPAQHVLRAEISCELGYQAVDNPTKTPPYVEGCGWATQPTGGAPVPIIMTCADMPKMLVASGGYATVDASISSFCAVN